MAPLVLSHPSVPFLASWGLRAGTRAGDGDLRRRPDGTGGSTVADGGVGGSDGGGGGDADGGPSGPFWCPGYQESAALTGWVGIDVVLQSSVAGGMTSPIQSCQVGASEWSVTAAGTERDGIDETTMSFKDHRHVRP